MLDDFGKGIKNVVLVAVYCFDWLEYRCVGSWEIQLSNRFNQEISAWSNIAACPIPKL